MIIIRDCIYSKLNKPPSKTATFPHQALKIFDKYYILKRNYINDIPVDNDYRIIIRSISYSHPTERSFLYFVGFIIDQNYFKSYKYIDIIEGIRRISLDEVFSLVDRKNISQIEISPPELVRPVNLKDSNEANLSHTAIFLDDRNRKIRESCTPDLTYINKSKTKNIKRFRKFFFNIFTIKKIFAIILSISFVLLATAIYRKSTVNIFIFDNNLRIYSEIIKTENNFILAQSNSKTGVKYFIIKLGKTFEQLKKDGNSKAIYKGFEEYNKNKSLEELFKNIEFSPSDANVELEY